MAGPLGRWGALLRAISLALALSTVGCHATDPTSPVGTFGTKLAGREITLSLADDGIARMTVSFAPVAQSVQSVQSVQTGTWAPDGDNIQVRFTQLNGLPQQNEMTFRLEDGNLRPVKWDEHVYDGEALRLARF